MTNLLYISQLTAAPSVASTDLVPLTQGSTGGGTGTTRKATVAQLIAGVSTTTVFASLVGTPSYSTDAAAAAGGVAIGAAYRNGSIIQVRMT